MILVTGYKGFIGSFLYKKLKQYGYDVVGFEWGDELNLANLHTVMHLGAISSTTERNVEKIMLQNYQFSSLLLDECIKRNINFQYASSASVYGQKNYYKASEDMPVDPLTPYAWSKYLFERYASEKIKTDPKSIIQGFRYFNVWSKKGEDHKGNQSSPYFKFIKDAKNKKTITLFQGSQFYKRDFIHVNDIVDYHIKFLNVKESGLWNLGSGTAKSFLDVAIEVQAEYPCEFNFIQMPDNLKNSYQYYTCADMTKTHFTLNQYNKERVRL